MDQGNQEQPNDSVNWSGIYIGVLAFLVVQIMVYAIISQVYG